MSNIRKVPAAAATIYYIMIFNLNIFIKRKGESLEWVSIVPPMSGGLMIWCCVYITIIQGW